MNDEPRRRRLPATWRNQREPTALDTPTAAAACSLLTPVAISFQNNRSTSRRCEGRPGDFNADLPVISCIHAAGLPTIHLHYLECCDDQLKPPYLPVAV